MDRREVRRRSLLATCRLDAFRRGFHNQMVAMRIFAIALLSATVLFAQDESVKIRPGDSRNAQGKQLGQIPTGVVDVKKTKGTISQVDLVARTVSIQTKKNSEALVLSFSQPQGREQIKTTKKAQKKLGKKRLRLDELAVGTQVQLRYYPALGQIMELTVAAN